ncbi:hypothetical protein KY084_11980 [Stakelama sp. CBK3Z-3]|uniref:Transcriptional regulator MraZ n=1 Tax=Stakelama flava TaxID=2860338 RepID=A0ABS6XMZ7_9SPHN|nr:hypothetical protein [Stakelama flava]MBW4331587.1 hypothetical protein [Stakelama flava]
MLEGTLRSAVMPWPIPNAQDDCPGSFSSAVSKFLLSRRPEGFEHSVPLGGAAPYVGHCLARVKSNGTVRLPWFVRRNSDVKGTGLFLGMHGDNNCLIGSSLLWWQRLTLTLDTHRFLPSERPVDAPPPKTARRLFGFCEEFHRPDGFVTLPGWGRTITGIRETALFVGTGETFEVWAIEEAMDSPDETLRALARSAMTIDAAEDQS